MKQAVLRFIEVERRFGDKCVLDEISFDLHSGEILGLIGANGAGKTTLLQLAAGFLKPTSGRIDSEGRSSGSVLFLRDKPSFYPNLTVSETLRCLCDVMRAGDQIDVDRAMENSGLTQFKDEKTNTLSMGTRQRLNWAHALLLRPSVLLLDEPTSFLDPPGVMALRNTLLLLSSLGTAVLLSSHNLHEVEKLCNRVLFLESGSIRLLAHHETKSVEALESSFEVNRGGSSH